MQSSNEKIFGENCAQKEQYSECSYCWGSAMCCWFQLPCKWSGIAWSTDSAFPWIHTEMQDYLLIQGRWGLQHYNSNSSSALEQETKHFCMSLGGQCAKDHTLQHWQVCVSEEKGISPLSCTAAPTARAWNQIFSEVSSYPIHAVI